MKKVLVLFVGMLLMALWTSPISMLAQTSPLPNPGVPTRTPVAPPLPPCTVENGCLTFTSPIDPPVRALDVQSTADEVHEDSKPLPTVSQETLAAGECRLRARHFFYDAEVMCP